MEKVQMNLNNKKRLTNDIVIFENFLTPEQCQSVIDIIEKQVSLDKLSWTPITFYESYSSVLPQDNDEELAEFGLSNTFFSEIQEGIINAVAQIHDKNPKDINKIGYHTQKWEPGAYAKEHSDNTDLEGNFGPFERSRYAAFLYLNEDFEGGLLNFLKQGVTLRPQTGLLAAFSGSFENTHEVTMITKGIRYTLGSFWDDRDESAYPQELRDAWQKEMKEIRDKQEEIKGEWQDKLKNGYKIDMNGNEYKIEEND
jgi:hypothetical protein